MAEAYRFWDRLADKYVDQPIADVPSYEKKLEITRSYLRPEMELLEFGCGSGGTARIHAPYVKHIRAIDFSARMIETARSRATAEGVDNVTFEVADITGIAETDGPYDMILGLSVLHLMADPDAVIAKVHRMLKPGGRFVSSTACMGDTLAFFKLLAPIGRAAGLLPILSVMTHAELIASVTGAGFAIERDWQPGKGKAVFMVARKVGAGAAG